MPNDPPIELVERDGALHVLAQRLQAVADGTGHIALIAGEAGIGKTSVLKFVAMSHPRVEVWWGNCDALQTPHPLAPLHDVARSGKVAFGALLAAGSDRQALFEAVLRELQHGIRPTVFVIEDAHWADDATLDLLKFLGRRIDRAACLLVISYRDDEVTSTHPLRRVLGELPASFVTRVNLARLSPVAVELMARRALRSSGGIYAATHGNPFFVSELLRHGIDGVPDSVQDLVLARFARLSPQAQEVVKLISIIPAKAEDRLVANLLEQDLAAVDECLNSGLLTAADSTLFFRHELARVAIETSLSEPAARKYHARELAVLEREDGGASALARLVHHAARAGDSAAVLRYAPRAAHDARARGAHRESAAQYRVALEHASGVDDVQHAVLLEAYSDESRWTDQSDETIAARLRLDELYRRTGNVVGEAQNLSALALTYVMTSRNADAGDASRRAIELLEARAPAAPLAGAYRAEAHLKMLGREWDASIVSSKKAIALAQKFGTREILAAAYGTLGTATLFVDYDDGRAQLLRAFELARSEGLHLIAAGSLCNLGSASGELYHLREAEQHLVDAVAYSHRYETDCYRVYSTAWLALTEMHLGQWDDATEHALDVIGQTTDAATRIMALVALGRLQARRGDPAATPTLDEALELALTVNTLQRLAPVRCVRAEAAYLRGDLQAAAEEARPALTAAIRHQHPWFSGELAYWMQRAGALDTVPVSCAEPFALQLTGRWSESARQWANLGCPYEQARALADGTADAQLEALALFEGLGARPAAEGVRRKLRSAGERNVPRGARASTQANPHELTDRELEVLLLLCEGLKNSEIAERLCRSVRTVDHHVAAAFAKLGVSSRTEAVAATLRTGIRPQNRQVAAAK